MLGLILAILVTILVARMVLKKYKPQATLMFGGILLMVIAVAIGAGTVLPEGKSTGLVWFDIFEFIKATFSNRGAGLGLLIMSVAGFAKYMEHIGASGSLVRLVIKPMQKLNSPYLVLALGYLIGQLLNIFIPSASGLGVILMVTMFPLLVKLGVSPLAATAMIGTSAALDLGPASGNANLAAETAGMDVSVYFVDYQIPVAIAVVLVIAVLHYFVQKWFDKKDGYISNNKEELEGGSAFEKEESKIPAIYAILPIIPLLFILIFSRFVIPGINMNVITAMLIGLFISLIFELIRHKNVKKVFESIQIFFDGMGVQFATVVTLIVAGQTFAHGLKSIGAIDTIIEAAQSAGFGAGIMILVMTAIIAVSAVLMGSGNAPFFAFAALAPDVAAKMSIPAVLMLLPMQFAAGIARSVSPITAVIIAISGISNVSPVDIVKRTVIPMLGALLTTIIMNFILF
ncbi:MAG: C4-dicarboxylate transporter DcuC [Clostridiales bacterium]|nr:C4-dicarboxylate transporter DcuC [Clostridiales bacterium]